MFIRKFDGPPNAGVFTRDAVSLLVVWICGLAIFGELGREVDGPFGMSTRDIGPLLDVWSCGLVLSGVLCREVDGSFRKLPRDAETPPAVFPSGVII